MCMIIQTYSKTRISFGDDFLTVHVKSLHEFYHHWQYVRRAFDITHTGIVIYKLESSFTRRSLKQSAGFLSSVSHD